MTAAGPLTPSPDVPEFNAMSRGQLATPQSVVPKAQSLGTNSIARLLADLIGLGLSLVAATVTARLLGPAGKGYYSSLVLLGGLFVHVFTVGLGEAGIVLSGRGRTTLQAAMSATALAILPLSLLGAGAFLLTANIVLGGGDSALAPTFGCILVAATIWYTTSVAFLLAQEKVVAVAALSVLSAALSTALLWFLVAVADLGTSGALIAGIISVLIPTIITLVLLQRGGLSPVPRWAPGYLKAAIVFGSSLQFSNLLVLLTARLDLVLVYRMSTPAEAGAYSIALTIGALVGAVPIAISYAAFPRLALVGDEEAQVLTAQVFRIGIVAAVAASVALAIVTPFLVHVAFGSAYGQAVIPTLLLIPGGVLWSAQWLLCRAAAARGNATALLVSFAVSFAVMVALDYVLIGAHGGVGAAVASLVAPVFGLLVTSAYCRKMGWRSREFIPRPSDLRALVGTVRAVVAPRA